jgi:hypothetical protein
MQEYKIYGINMEENIYDLSFCDEFWRLDP